jgi:hypothetical protein
MAKSTSISLRRLRTGVVLLVLIPIAVSQADALTQGTADAGGNPDPAGNHVVGGGPYASEVPQRELIDNEDGTALAADNDEASIPVAQELDFILGNGFRKRGAYDDSLKTVASVDYYGTRYVGCESYPLEVRTARPDRIATLVQTGGSSKFESRTSSKGIVIRGKPQGLAIEEERALLETFAFDTPINELENKKQVFKPLGMQKLPGTLTWKLGVDRPGGYRQILYVDSHNGDVVKSTIINAQGAPVLDVALHDYRSIEGIRVRFATDYRSPDGTLLASDRIERVVVKRTRS